MVFIGDVVYRKCETRFGFERFGNARMQKGFAVDAFLVRAVAIGFTAVMQFAGQIDLERQVPSANQMFAENRFVWQIYNV